MDERDHWPNPHTFAFGHCVLQFIHSLYSFDASVKYLYMLFVESEGIGEEREQ